jgi:MOSC domain-containing protein
MWYTADTGNPRRLEKHLPMRVVQMWRFPVKSMGGEPLRSVELGAGGMPFDRRYAVMDSDPARAGKPLTARIDKRLLGYAALVRGSTIFVRTPDGGEHDVDSPAWLEQLARDIDRPVTLQSFPEAIHDDSDILVLNAASLRAISEEYGTFVNPLRFRPNFVVDGPDLPAYAEGAWLGREVSVGDVVLHVHKPDQRCVVTTIDPETLVSDPSFLRLIVKEHAGCFGMYCSVVRSGSVALGDEWRPQRPSGVGV